MLTLTIPACLARYHASSRHPSLRQGLCVCDTVTGGLTAQRRDQLSACLLPERKWEAGFGTMWLFLDIDIVPVPNKASFGMNTLGFCCQSFDRIVQVQVSLSEAGNACHSKSWLISPLTGAIAAGRRCRRVTVVGCTSSEDQDCNTY